MHFSYLSRKRKKPLMAGRVYSQHLGLTSDEQFQAALDRFHLGRLITAILLPKFAPSFASRCQEMVQISLASEQIL